MITLIFTANITSLPVLHVDAKGDICVKGSVKHESNYIRVISYDFSIINFVLNNFKPQDEVQANITGSGFFRAYNNNAGFPAVFVSVLLETIKIGDTEMSKKDEVDYVLKYNTYHYVLKNYNDDKKVNSAAPENVVISKFKELHQLIFPEVDFTTVKTVKSVVEENDINAVIKRQKLSLTDALKKRLLEKSNLIDDDDDVNM